MAVVQENLSVPAVQRIQRYTQVTTAVVKATMRIVGYLKRTREQGIGYSPVGEAQFRDQYQAILQKASLPAYRTAISRPSNGLADLVAFSDSDFAGCPVSLKSTSGVILYFRGCPLLWSSKRQTLRAHSTTEAEYIAAHDGIVIVRQQQGYLSYLLQQKEALPYNLFVDNQSALMVSQQSIPTKKSKHFALRYLAVRDECDNLAYVPTADNRADPFTKAEPKDCYSKLLVNKVRDSHLAEDGDC